MTEVYFITGTDTKVGKTTSAIALLKVAKQLGYITAAYKPVASGAKYMTDGLRNNDSLLLQDNSSIELAYHEVNPYTFAEHTSPHIISYNKKKPISFSVLSTGLQLLKHRAEWVLIEGAGGWFTPLSKYQTFADWVVLEKIPVILVVGIKIGCINHAILTTQAIIRSRLELVGWIANNIIPPDRWHTEYIATLSYLLSAPLLGEIPWFEKEVNYVNASNYLDVNVLQQVFSYR